MVADRYRLDERIGSGGMGVVWRAHDVRLNRTVAVKQLLLGPGLSPGEADESRARAMREGRIAARLHHPHAINVFDVALGPDLEHGEDDQPWLVMEYLPSRSLADVLAERGPLPPLEVARIGRQVADALAAAHQAGIVHRDVKPGNVLIGENGTVKITDFGIARASWDPTVTRTGVLTGTPAYFAPEVARGEAPDPASDVFSLGATLYTAVEGVPPFGNDDNTLALLRTIADGDARPPKNAGPLSALLVQLLRYDPAQRPVMAVTRDLLGRIAAKGNETPTTASLLAAVDGPPSQPGPSSVAPPASSPGAGTLIQADPPPASPPMAPAQAATDNDENVLSAPPPVALPETATDTDEDLYTAPPRDRPTPWWQRVRVLAVLMVLLLVAVGAVIFALALGGSDDPSTAATQSNPANAPATTAETTSEPSVTTPEATTPEATPPPPAAPGPAEYEEAVRTYYGLLPDQLDAAYAYLGPAVQDQAGGRGGYENFWSQFRDIGTENVRAEGTTVSLTIVYTNPDGSTFREGYVLEMGTAEDGRILILTSQIV
jgi:serine/threonine protein kinase